MPVLYASSPRRAAAQILGDISLVLWGVTCWTLASYLRDAILKLADAARSLSQRSTGLASSFDSAAEQMGNVPVVGGAASTPLRQASRAISDLAGSGGSQAENVTQLAWWVFAAVFALPLLGACLNWLPRRFAFIREATAARKFINGDEDVELFALRAMAHQPMYKLARISDDPVGAWRDGDSDIIRALARLELADNGLRLPKKSGPSKGDAARTTPVAAVRASVPRKSGAAPAGRSTFPTTLGRKSSESATEPWARPEKARSDQTGSGPAGSGQD